MREIENLVFEGGGVLGFAYVGVVQVLDEKNILKNCKRFAGSSAGAITAALLACGANSKFLQTALESLDARELLDSSTFIPFNIYRLWNEGGWAKGIKLEQWINNLLAALCDGKKDLTFQQIFEKFGTALVVTGTCLETRKTEYFSKDNFPLMPVASAVRISAGYPGVYPMIESMNFHWWDGGIGDNYPIHVFDDVLEKQCKKRIPNAKTVGFKLVSQEDSDILHIKPINNVKDAVLSIGNMILDMSRLVHVREIDWNRSVLINVGTMSAMHFDITEQEKSVLINNGRVAIEDFVADFSE